MKCEAYGFSFLNPVTCIANQKKLKELMPKVRAKEAAGEYPCYAEYQKIEKCRDCPAGLKYYQESKKEKPMEDKKTCIQCKESYPRTREYFDEANRAADHLTKNCRYCRGTKDKGKVESEKLSVPIEAASCDDCQEPKKEPFEMQTCPDCGGEFELKSENFWKNPKTKTGFEAKCKVCARQAKKNARKIRAGKTPENIIVLNFNKHMDLYEKVKKWAEQEMRDPDKQILYALKNSSNKILAS